LIVIATYTHRGFKNNETEAGGAAKEGNQRCREKDYPPTEKEYRKIPRLRLLAAKVWRGETRTGRGTMPLVICLVAPIFLLLRFIITQEGKG